MKSDLLLFVGLLRDSRQNLPSAALPHCLRFVDRDDFDRFHL